MRVQLEITPEPSEEERAAIAAALGEDAEDELSDWVREVLPQRNETSDA